MNHMTYRTLISALLLAASWTCASEAPTQAEWAPIATMIEQNGPDVTRQLESVTTRYPQWADGHRALALARLRNTDAKGAYSAARAALKLSAGDIDAGIIALQALALQNRHNDAFLVAGTFSDTTDSTGQVAAQAAMLALQVNDSARLQLFIDAATKRAAGKPNPVLYVITARQALANKNFAAAATSLEQAIALRPDYRDAIFELGRVRMVQALDQPAQANDYLTKAEDAFQLAARLDNRDAYARFGLGRARLERGKAMIASGHKDQGEATLRSALMAFDEGMMIKSDDPDTKLWKGDALLRLERYGEAVPCLRFAFNSGVKDRALPFNLALALTRSGKTDEANEVLATIEAKTPSEQLTVAMNLFNQKNWAMARDLFLKTTASEDLTEGPQRQATIRYYAHCERELAAMEQDPVLRNERLDSASRAYLAAGNEGDFMARNWYISMQSERTPLKAFEAGKQSLGWNGFFHPPAWRLLIANYGYKVTRGEGFNGAWKYGLAHISLWTLIAMIPLGLFFKGWLLPGGQGGAGRKPGPPGTPGAPGVSRKPNPGVRPTPRPSGKPGARVVTPGAAKTPFSK